jgi:hypothetical protein
VSHPSAHPYREIKLLHTRRPDLYSDFLRNLAVELRGEGCRVVGVNLRVLAGSLNCDVGEPAVNQLPVLQITGRDVDDHPVSRLALTAVARHRVTVIQVRMFPHVELHAAARFEAQSEVAVAIDSLDGRQLTIGDPLLAERCRELNAVTLREFPVFTLIDIHPL